MADTQHYDAIVIGSGQAGMPLSTALVKSGRKTAMIEREHVGGTCINTGCTPTKTMIASARIAYLARRASDYGVHTSLASVNMVEVRQRKRAVVADFRDGDEKRIVGGGVDLIMGEASFTGPRSLRVLTNDGKTLKMDADTIFIDTGTRPASPHLEGLNSVHYYDSTSIMELDVVPTHLLVLGGGYIGLEFAQMFRRFGSEVTIINRGKQLLSKEDSDVADAVADILKEDGIKILFEAESMRVARGQGGVGVSFTVRISGEELQLAGSHLLVATGRTPNSDSLNLGMAGIEADERGFIRVNGKLETNVPGVYAVGEANGEPAFTHISYDDFRIICANLLYGHNVTTEGRMLPYVVFTDPQLGRVGIGEDAARAKSLNIKVAKIPMNYVARALETGETRGFMKAIVDADTGQILGCAVLGIEGGEIMAQIQIAMMGKLHYTVLRDAIFAHPTLAESLNTLFDALDEDEQ